MFGVPSDVGFEPRLFRWDDVHGTDDLDPVGRYAHRLLPHAAPRTVLFRHYCFGFTTVAFSVSGPLTSRSAVGFAGRYVAKTTPYTDWGEVSQSLMFHQVYSGLGDNYIGHVPSVLFRPRR